MGSIANHFYCYVFDCVMTSGIEWLYYNKNLKNKNSAHRS